MNLITYTIWGFLFSSLLEHERCEGNTGHSRSNWKVKASSNIVRKAQTESFDSEEMKTRDGYKNELGWRGNNSNTLTLNFISGLKGKTPNETFRIVNRNLRELENVLRTDTSLEEDFLKDLVNVIATCCRVSALENLNPLLAVLKNSLFFSKYMTDCLHLLQSTDPKLQNIEHVNTMSEMISIFIVYLRHFPSSYFDVPLEMMQRTVRLMQIEEKSQVENRLVELQAQRDEIIKTERRRLAKPVRDQFQKETKPPDNYREIQICPTLKELQSGERPFLRKNIKKGRYEDAEHYLDVQFRLYREDFIAPLREGIQEVINEVPRRERNQNIKLYHNVRIVGKELTKSGIVYKVNFESKRFRFTNWNQSKRLIFGSFLCLSRNNFNSMFFATVANRNPDQLKMGQFDIQFIGGQEVIGIERQNESFIMAESPAYFEAYRHVLVGLQELHETNLPFKQYLIQCAVDVEPPLYLRQNERAEYHFDKVFNRAIPPVNVLITQEWPQAERFSLNASQLEAFQTALTKEFTVIQGPPGTGKTYVGLKIVQTLLENRHFWDRRRHSPMLMVCFTNHALDQFLEGVKEFLPHGIIRVGGRCKSEKLQPFILRSHVNHHPQRSFIINQLKAWENYIKQAKTFSEVYNNKNLQFENIEEVIEDRFLNQLYYHPKLLELETISNLFKAWLLNIFPTTVSQKDSSVASKTGKPVTQQAATSDTIKVSGEDGMQILQQGSLAESTNENKQRSDTEGENSEAEIHEKSGRGSRFEENDNEASVEDVGEENVDVSRNSDKEDDHNGETITIDTEAELIQNQRCEEGEEDMFIPIDSVFYEDIRQNSTAKVDKEHLSHRKNEYYEQGAVSFKVSQADLLLVNKLLLSSQSYKQEEIEYIEDMWLLSQAERVRLYLYWLVCFREKWGRNAQRAEETYEILCNDLSKIKIQEDEMTLRRAAVIGMTTSCAAKYRSALQRIQPKIVIIEEAAEVLEAHILTSLTQGTEHVILIGDHKQLRPKPTVHHLAHKFNLEISLFERMVLNNMDCKQLSVQHRMRPEIARLTKRIYDHDILDSAGVQEYPQIRGMQQHLYFIDHTEPERFHEGLQSYSNSHEAGFAVALCKYLLQQGYERSQITILTMYTGQLLEIKEKMPSATFKGVRLSAVDNFQGEENDLVILSLVRSNNQDSVGFLKESNRICVSLSRARMALFAIGNFSLLCSQSLLWKDICEDLKSEGKMGNAMRLECAKHKCITEVETERDFLKVPLGGCNKSCEDRLECGHVCVLQCHASDPQHEMYKCRKLCLERCSAGHPCKKECHYRRGCGKCNVEVAKTFPGCGHVTKTACGNDIKNIDCLHRCERVLKCGHQCQGRCSQACNTNRCSVIVEKTLPCGHHRKILCSLEPNFVKCIKPCAKLLECQHICPGKCHENCNTHVCKEKVHVVLRCGHSVELNCSQQKSEVQCEKPCENKLQCGHSCPNKCFEICPHNYCREKVLKTLPCGHTKIVKCSKSTSEVVCSKPCERYLPCGHLCPASCGNDCKRASCCKLVDKSLSCGHVQQVRCGDYPNFICQSLCNKSLCVHGHLCKKKCHFGEESCGKCDRMVKKKISSCNHEVQAECWKDQSTLICDKPCTRKLMCGHRCKLKCGEKCQNSVCKEKTAKQLKCGHSKNVPCFEDENEYKCQVKVKKVLPCGHEQTCCCYQNQEEIMCKAIVAVELRGCGHTKQLACFRAKKFEEGKISLFCETIVTKHLPCGHDMKLACGANPLEAACQSSCQKILPCGIHRCMKKCGEDCSKSVCQNKCTKYLECGHRCSGLCGQDCIPCKEKCTRLLPCNHPCQGLCCDPCDPSKCTKLIKKQFPCGHKTKRGVLCTDYIQAVCQQKCQRKLECGHICPGVCGLPCSQYKCKLPCGRSLVCSHRCRAPCSEPCPPCARPCQRSCIHTRCRKQCWEECEPCQLPCASSCPHFQCNNLCHEICNRPLCNEPCQKKLRCGHSCIGLCGEICPSICRVCDSKKLAAINQGRTQSIDTRYIQLFNCGHVFEVSFLDNWMSAKSDGAGQKQIDLKCCPVCSVPVSFSFRYSNVASSTTKILSLGQTAHDSR